MNSNNEKGSSVLGAAIFGAVVGAAAVTLLNKDMRKNIKMALIDSLEKGDERLQEASQKIDELRSKATKRTAEKIKDVRKKLEQTT